MKKVLLTLFAGMLFSQVNAQYWQYANINAGQNPSGLNNDTEQPSPSGWTSLMATQASPTWSAATNIPFAFTFNGTAVTQFKASSTGVVTFDVGTALAAPSSSNAALPNAAIPNNSVCIWGIQGTGTNDAIVTKTFGTAPNRQFWIQYNSYSIASNAAAWCYWSIVLEETSNKVFIVDHRSGSNAGAVTVALTAGLQFSSSSAMSVAGSPALNTQTTATMADDPSDNTYYEFTPGVQPANDIKAISVTAPNYMLAGNQNIAITVKNMGSANITSYTIKYKDGASAPVSQLVTSTIAPFGTNATTFTTPLNVTLGAHPLTIWAELTGDNNHTNDTLTSKFTGVSVFPKHRVVMEEPTGTWCQWCPRGAIYMDSIAKAKPNDVVVISVHNGDPMVVAAYDAGVGALIGGYPSLLVDRKEEADPSQAFDQFTKHTGDFAFADISATHTISGNALTVNAKVTPATDLSGDWRLALVPIEDRCHGTNSTWNQSNAYSGNATPMANTEFNFNTLPNPVPAAQMYYDYVARDIVGGFDGAAGTLPTSMTNGTPYTKTFNYTIPATWGTSGIAPNISRMKYAVLFIDKTGNAGVIRNAVEATVFPLGFSDIVKNNIIEAVAYPNPATDKISIDFTTTEAVKATYSIVDMTGKIIATKDLGTLSTGANTVEIATANFAAGMYSIVLTTDKGTFQSKFTKK